MTSPEPRTLQAVLAAWVARDPQRTIFYIHTGGQSYEVLSFARLEREALQVAGKLAGLGVAAGDRVIVALETSPGAVASFFGALLLGAVPCMMDAVGARSTMAPWAERLLARAKLVGARAAIVDGVAASTLRPDDRLDHLILVSPEVAGVPPWTRAVAGRPEDVAFMQFTSGTTGHAKAIQITHAAALANLRAVGSKLDFDEHSVMVSWLPLFHDMGLVASMLTAFVAGCPVVMMAPSTFIMNPVRWLRALHDFRGTHSFAPNFAYHLTATRIKEAEAAQLDLSCWRHAMNAAEPVQWRTLVDFSERLAPAGFQLAAFRPSYGLAELVVGATFHGPAERGVRRQVISRAWLAGTGRIVTAADGHPDARIVIGCGSALDGHAVEIVGDDGRVLGEMQQGQIVLGGPSVFKGYYGDVDATVARLRGGKVWTGDLGYLDGGQLFVTGRVKDLIIRNGENVHPYDIEFEVAALDGVRAGGVAAVGLANEQTGTEDLWVLFETAMQAPSELARLRQDVAAVVFRKMRLKPDRVVALQPRTIPKTSSGKIQRVKLRDMIVAGDLAERVS